jgi:hypothetical protein
MSGKSTRVNPLQLRKQLLLAESELNRDQLVADMAELKAGLHIIKERAQSFDTIASSAAVLVIGLAALKRGRPESPGAKASWLQTLLKGTGLISTLWLAVRAHLRGPNES